MRLIRILLGVIVVVVMGLVGVLMILPGEKIAQLAADQVKTQTGRDLVFDGDVGISWYPIFGVSTGPVSLGNAEWSDAGPMFQAKSAAIGVDVIGALTGDIRITKIEAVAPDVLLEKARDGRVNWELLPTGEVAADQGAASAGADTNVSLESLIIKGARLRYLDHGGDNFEVANLDIGLSWPDVTKPAEISVTARPAGKDVDVAATVGNLNDLIGGSVSSLVAKVSATGGTVDFDGRVGIAPEAAGQVVADFSDAEAFLAALGLGGGVPGRARLEGDVTLTKDHRFSLRKGIITALGNTINAEADAALGGVRPIVTANVLAGKLDLSSLAGSSGSESSTASSSEWSREPIDASALALMDGKIVFGAEAIDLGDIDLGRTRASVQIENARAVATLTELAAYGGAIKGQFVANNRNGFSMRGDLDVSQIALKELLSATAGLNRFTGKADMKMDFLGSGQSEYAIMNSLKGSGTVKVGRGTIEGIDLDRLFRGDLTGGTTVFDNMGASWTIEKGVMRNEDLLMELPNVIAIGAGTVGLGQRVIDYRFTPQLRKEEGTGLAVPVKVEGSWDNPSIAPDLDAILKQNLDEELKELEAEAVKRVEEELGVEKQEGESTEDAVRRTLEDEATKGLLKLLGNN
ncbi:AsmA family protein [Shimia sp.]|uniref:AsmA family protein n=1 Tax=Shimia sp. TaxID=1954381 RepID=UPI0032986C88